MKKILFLLVAAIVAASLSACGSEDTAKETTSAEETTAAAESTETSEPAFEPVAVELTAAEQSMLSAYTSTIYGAPVDAAATKTDEYVEGKETMGVFTVTLTDGTSLTLEFSDTMANTGYVVLNEGTDANGYVSRRLFDIVGDICIGASLDCPFTAENYEEMAKNIAGDGATVTAADDDVVEHRLMKVYDVAGADFTKLAFDDLTNHACTYTEAGGWTDITN